MYIKKLRIQICADAVVQRALGWEKLEILVSSFTSHRHSCKKNPSLIFNPPCKHCGSWGSGTHRFPHMVRSCTLTSPLPMPAAIHPPQARFGFHTTCVTPSSASWIVDITMPSCACWIESRCSPILTTL